MSVEAKLLLIAISDHPGLLQQNTQLSIGVSRTDMRHDLA
ncbi:hypothetical protein MBRU_19185 [Mycolicibacterium brumae DSM 44177]|nr:hypothetical protein MBRU_19185 [Mycolicibacterium brumae DSM 44177]